MAETKKAFRKLPNLEQAITALSNLKGVGTTMASGGYFNYFKFWSSMISHWEWFIKFFGHSAFNEIIIQA